MYLLVRHRKNTKANPSISVELMKSIRHGVIVRKRIIRHLGTLKVDDSEIPGEIGRFINSCIIELQSVVPDANSQAKLRVQLEEKICNRLCGYTNGATNIKSGGEL